MIFYISIDTKHESIQSKYSTGHTSYFGKPHPALPPSSYTQVCFKYNKNSRKIGTFFAKRSNIIIPLNFELWLVGRLLYTCLERFESSKSIILLSHKKYINLAATKIIRIGISTNL